MTSDDLTKTIGWIVMLMVVVAAVGCVTPSSSDRSTTQPIPTTTPVRPEHNLQKSERESPIYINYNVNATKDAIMDVCSEYKDSLVYMQGETDCNDMAVYLWNMLQKRGVKTLLVIGTPDGEPTPFADCDHAWLVCKVPDGGIGIEPTVPMMIYSNCVYTFRTSAEVDEYMENDVVVQSIIKCNEDDEKFIREAEKITGIHYDRHEADMSEFQELLAAIRSDARYICSERPGDYSDFDYGQGYYYAKPSDLRKDVGDRW